MLPDEVGVFSRCRALTLFAGRPAATYHEAANDAHLWAYFDSIGARYVVVSVSSEAGFARDRAYLLPFVQRYPDRFDEVYANPDFSVFRITRVAIGHDERQADRSPVSQRFAPASARQAGRMLSPVVRHVFLQSYVSTIWPARGKLSRAPGNDL
jgi:hypothetical protein